MEKIRKISIQLFFIISIAAFPALGQQAGKLSLLLTPGVNLPVGTPAEMFTIGGGAELSGIYPAPPAPWLSVKGSLDYSIVPIAAEEISEALNLLTVSAGAGPVAQPAAWLTLYAFGSAGYGLGFYKGEAGGSAYIGAEGGVSFVLSPSFGLGLGAGYRHYISKPSPFYQGVNFHLGTLFSIGNDSGKSNLEIFDIQLDPVFPVFYKHYDDHSLGSFVIQNNEAGSIQDIKISLNIQQYMDSPKLCTAVDSLKKKETAEIPLYALFTDDVLNITEGTKVAAEVIAAYTYQGKELTKKEALTIRLYDRNAMTWDDDRKAAAFVTAKAPELLKISKNIAGMIRDSINSAVNLNFRIGMGLFEGLGIYGINYVVDPKSPYSNLSTDAAAVDYLQFPVQTLEYKAGDCDDLSILYAALLESTGIETAFITVPGHIFTAFSLELAPADAKKLFHNAGNLIFIDDKTWLPVEITMIQHGFLKAWDKGARQWREHNSTGKASLYPVHSAWSEYEPVGLPVVSNGIAEIRQNECMQRYSEVLQTFIENEISDEVSVLEAKIADGGNISRFQNSLGVLFARYGMLDKAEELFETASNSQYVPAMINIGNLLYLKEKYDAALKYYEQAEEIRPGRTSALLGIARVNYELENYGTVRKTYEQIRQKDPAAAAEFSYLASGYDENTRASAAMERQNVSWAEE